MPKRIRKPQKQKRPKDVSQWAHQIVTGATKEEPEPPKEEISKVMAAMGRKGGKIGGKRRLETMSDEERSEAGSHAAKARWAER
jgi:hypothetical protein